MSFLRTGNMWKSTRKVDEKPHSGGKVFVAISLIAFLAGIPNLVFAQPGVEESDNVTFYGGVVFLPLETKEMEDVHVSDWQNFGTGSMEGRVHLPLSEGETSGLRLGYMVGVEYDLLQRFNVYQGLPFIAEIQLSPTSEAFKYFQALIGANLRLLKSPHFDLRLSPKIGYAMLQGDFGEVEMLPGKTPPVITPEGTFRVGEKIKSDMSGVAIQANLSAFYKITERIGLDLQVGWNQAFLGDLTIEAGDVELKYDSPTVVEPVLDIGDGTSSSTQAGVDPSLSSSGVTIFVGLSYMWSF